MVKKRNPLKLSDQTKPRQSYIDYDYVNKLSPSERKFLSKFTDEYYGGVFEPNDKKNLIKGEENHRFLWREDWRRRVCQLNLAQIGQRLSTEATLVKCETEVELSFSEILDIIEKRIKYVTADQLKTLLDEIKEFYNSAYN